MKIAEPVNPADLTTRVKPAASEPSAAEPSANPEPVSNANADASQIAATLMQAAPEVQPAAIQEHKNQAKADALKDSKGVLFDETIHARGPDGKPAKTTSGEWAKRRGRKAGKPGTLGNAGPAGGSVLAGAGGPLADPTAQARTAGAQAAQLYVSLGMMLGGEEWLPVQIPAQGIDEMAFLQKLFGDYFVATNRKDIPPGVALSFGLLAYTAPRLFKPNTRQRLSAAKAWATDKVRRVYVWWAGRRAK